MSALSATPTPVHLKTAHQDRLVAAGQIGGSNAINPRPSSRRLFILFIMGALVLAGGVSWFIYSAGYETTDDATIEAHVIQVSPKISAHVKAVHFDDNYQVKRGDLLIELDPRDYEVKPGQRRRQPGIGPKQAYGSRSATERGASRLGPGKSGSR